MPRESLQMCSKTVSLWQPSPPIPARVGITEVPTPVPQEAASASTFRGGRGHPLF